MTTRVGDHVQIRNTQARVTPRPAGERFRDALGQGASELLTGVEQLAGLAPGGSAVTAAVRGAASAGSTGGSQGAQSAEGPGGDTASSPMSSALMDSTSQSMQLLELQQQISMEQRQFTTVSNVMKARHDTAKSVINNVR